METGELDNVTRMFKVWHTVLSMLTDRGYHIAKEKLDMSKETFVSTFTEMGEGSQEVQYPKLRINARMVDDPTKSIMVFFCSESKMSTETLKLYDKAMKEEISSRSAIIVLRKTLSPMCRTKIREMELKEGRHIELFTEAELVVDITKHILVPRHIVLSEKEKEDILKR